MRRTLVLKKETLTDLSPHDLAQVAGAAATPYCPTYDTCRIPTDHCVMPTDRCGETNVVCLSYVMDPCVTAGCV